MADQQPDEQYHFIGWSIERFGNRHFLERHGADFYPVPSARVEIKPTDFGALMSKQVSPSKVLRKHGIPALTRGLENPSAGVKVFLVASFVLIGGTLLALLAGWI